MIVTVEVDISALVDLLQLVRNQAPAAISRSLNRAGDAAATVLGRELASQSGLGVRAVRDELDLSHSTPADLEYTITVPGRFMTLKEFAPREVKRGISARPWGRRRTFPHAFMIQDIPFIREGEARLPVRPLFGPSLGVEVGRGNALEAARQRFREVVPQRLVHELSRLGIGKGTGGDGD